ncbi:MAG: hypothetical protein ACRCTZ_16120 [Sarcina sp.]
MKRFKQCNLNKKFAKQVKKLVKKYGATNFRTGHGYFVFSMDKHNVIHFMLPNNYKVGIWQDRCKIFAEHLNNMDKFKPMYTEYTDEYASMVDVKAFVKMVASINSDEDNRELLESNKKVLEFENEMYNYMKNMEGVHKVDVINNGYDVQINITLESEEVDERPIDELIRLKFRDTEFDIRWNSKYDNAVYGIEYFDV